MARTMRVTLEVDVDDLPKETLEECARDMDLSLEEAGLAGPQIDEFANEPEEIASRIADNLVGEGCDEMLFAGSNMYVHFTAAKLVSAEWLGEPNT